MAQSPPEKEKSKLTLSLVSQTALKLWENHPQAADEVQKGPSFWIRDAIRFLEKCQEQIELLNT
jgi:hypothetical protein